MEDDNKKKLINETVTGRKLNAERLLRYIVISAACGLAFGITATYAYKLISSAFDRNAPEQQESVYALETNESDERTSVSGATAESNAAGTHGSDEASGQNAGSSAETAVDATTKDAAAGDSGNTGSGAEADADADSKSDAKSGAADGSEHFGAKYGGEAADPVEDADAQATDTEKAAFSEEILSAVKNAVSESDKYLVSISVTSQSTTWFDDTTESTEEYAGAVIKVDEHEILILSTCTDTDDKTLKVTFNNGSSSDAYIKQRSSTDGLSVIAVSATEGMSEETLESIIPAEYCDCGELQNGEYLVAVGAPMGVNHSCDYSIVGYINENEPAADRIQQVIYSAITHDDRKGTFITDLNGHLVGVVVRIHRRLMSMLTPVLQGSSARIRLRPLLIRCLSAKKKPMSESWA